MSNHNTKIKIFEHEIQQAFPNLKDKLIIDYINGLDISQNLNNKSKASHRFFTRNIELISGVQKLRQESINDHLIVGLQACREYFNEMSSHTQQHSYAMIQLKQSLDNTQNQITEIVEFVADFKASVDERFSIINSQINELDSHQRAVSHMDNVLSRWYADKLVGLSPMGQCYCILDNLKWGDFGSYLYSSSNVNEKARLLDTLENKIIKAQKDILKVDVFTDISRTKWLEKPKENQLTNTLEDTLQYQGDLSYQDPDKYPLIFTATQISLLDDQEKDKYSRLTRRRLDIDRVSKRMVSELFRSAA